MNSYSHQNLLALYNAGQYQQVLSLTGSIDMTSSVVDEIYTLRTFALYADQKPADALTGFRRIYDANPNDRGSFVSLATCLKVLGHFDELFAIAKAYYFISPTNEIGTLVIEVGLKNQAPADYLSEVFRNVFSEFFETFVDSKTIVSTHLPLSDWCAANHVELFELDPPVDVKVNDILTGADLSYMSQPTEIAVLQGAVALCGWDYPFTQTGHVLDNVGYLPITSKMMFAPQIASPYVNRVISLWADVIDVDEDVLFLSFPGFSGFGHWLIDFLPRLIAWRVQQNLQLKIFCPASLPGHFRESLERFGVKQEDLWEGDLYQTYRFRTLTVCRLAQWGVRSPLVEDFLYKHLGPPADYQVPPGMPESLVYLERSQTNRGRFIVNKAEFNETLGAHNVKTMRRPELSIAAQDAILWNAGVVITAFGSDIHALYQLRRGTDLMVFYFEDLDELSEEGELGLALARTCSLLGVRLTRVYCTAGPGDARAGYKRDLVVNCAQFSRQLTDILQRRNDKNAP